ncbi:hypothetical protein GobsT_02930 [Gemmata obscuriglobus]|uniref:Uncharacterized protein n=1 Tax=Gemmata obscuriglobus TaxID=114 RepID=A0A2Z3H5T1_9BACT|nr:hypothetical protein [Gemmata obscuriglobus]AWM41098.1 hypothetical protein C1280_31685 [Gemmata obscuriglobus]QEG25566.1 hypothetical protein GobsT_02930 [Gemmata obscuriglobus]VTR98968.1 unnamed protein product [Gemmata obscuriglobus UQM 2246]
MTPNTTATRTASIAQTADAETLLRDLAYVLKLTRRVKEEMTADRAPIQPKPATADRALVA